MTIYKRFSLDRRQAPRPLYLIASALRTRKIGTDHVDIEARTGQTSRLWGVAVLVALSKVYGLERTPQGSPGTYGLDIARNYEESDFAACELMLLGGSPTKHQTQDDRDAEGRLLLSREFIQDLRLGGVWRRTVVSNEMRHHLESAKLIGLQFREAVPRENFAGINGPFWELESSNILPKMANTNQMKYIGMRGAPHLPFDGDYSRMVFLDDAPYRSGEIHYRRSDLTRLRQFDVAQTFELYRHPHRELVISQRFYQICLKHDIKLNLEPVRVDPS